MREPGDETDDQGVPLSAYDGQGHPYHGPIGTQLAENFSRTPFQEATVITTGEAVGHRPRFLPVEDEPLSQTSQTSGGMNALAIVPDSGLGLFQDPAAMRAKLDVYAATRKVFIDWLFANLTAGVDYMLIHRSVGPKGQKQDCPNKDEKKSTRCQRCGGKATLCKPGSEKICGLLELRPAFSRDTETWEMLGSKPGVLAILCSLISRRGDIVAEGRGVREQGSDYGDLNKTIKMVQKSAQTDATLRYGGLSEVFSQDLEDAPHGGDEDAPPSAGNAPSRPSAPPTQAMAPAPPPSPPPGGIAIADVRLKTFPKRDGSQGRSWVVVDTMGTAHETTDVNTGSLAEGCWKAKSLVEIVSVQNGTWPRRITSLRAV